MSSFMQLQELQYVVEASTVMSPLEEETSSFCCNRKIAIEWLLLILMDDTGEVRTRSI